MAAFSSLSERMSHIFSKLKNKGKLTELEVKQAMREVRVALLEADVNFNIVKDFVAKVSEKAIGEGILKSLTPDQQVIKIVNDELVELMGVVNHKLNLKDGELNVILMCGLQGSGKTTMCSKLGYMLRKQNKKVLLVACDIYRPAAIKQLQIVGKTANVEVFEMGQSDPREIVKKALAKAREEKFDVVIVDTAGRLHIDETLMSELKDIKEIINPIETLLVVDSMTGQDAVNVADTFNKAMEITGVILTKLDGDTRGGAALSIRAVSGKPIKFCGIGEKVSDIESFYPDRMASRILGMGDVLTLIEKAEAAISKEDAAQLQKKLRENKLTLSDYLEQMENMKKMGSVQDMIKMIPGLGSKIKGDVNIDEKQIERTKAIIKSMTEEERDNPDIIKSSRRKRIAQGSGTSIQDVNQLLKQFEQMKTMMQKFSSGKKGLRGLF